MAALRDEDRKIDVAAEMHEIRDLVRQQFQVSHNVAYGEEIARHLNQAKYAWKVEEKPFESTIPVVGPLIAGFRNAWNSVAAKWHVRRLLLQQNHYNHVIYETLARLFDALSSQQEYFSTQMNALSARTDMRLTHLETQYARFAERVEELGLRQITMRRVFDASLANRSGDSAAPSSEPAKSGDPDQNYLDFNAAFTAPGSVMREMYSQYLPLFQGRSDVLDAGCGQGHFLELLKEIAVEGYGVDRDLEMVEMCKLKGLRAVQGDAVEHLASIPADSLGGIFSGHLIEHLEPLVLRRFFALSYKALRPGGVLVCETPNTSSLYALANTYFRDVTHRQPIHPDTYQFMARSSGFDKVNLSFSYMLDPACQLLPLETKGELSEALNERMAKINALLYGNQNVAVIAYKPLHEDGDQNP